jgi:nucleotide-binding universal stress UspA family protein/predicted transcriptional regulator
MSFPFRRILSPVDFDENSLASLEVAAQIARQNDGTVLLFHVVPMMIAPTAMPVYVDIYRGQEETAKEKLRQIAAKRLQGIKYELLTHLGEPAGAIIRTAKRSAADVIVMATHGRRGFSRVMLGSVAEMVLREASCPVLCIRRGEPDKNLVTRWMSSSPVTTTPDEKLSTVEARMYDGNFRSAPVVDGGRLVGIVTERDIRSHLGYLETTEVKVAMIENVVTVTPTTPLHEAARLLFERKIDHLPVLEEAQLVGVISTSDILRAFLEED